MEFYLNLSLEKEEKETLATAIDIIRDLTQEMEYTGLETYQDKSSEDWLKITYAIQNLIG